MKKTLLSTIFLSLAFVVYAGGSPEYVELPDNYRENFSNYDTRNRGNGKQVAVLYANKVAVDSATKESLPDGSIVVMEIYKKKLDESGNALADENGLFEKGKFAAIAVMEKRETWEAAYDKGLRSGNWGFAIYNTDGSPKENDLDCASCHVPLANQDYLFSHSSLRSFTGH